LTGAQRWVTRYDGGGAATEFSHSTVVSSGSRVCVMFSIGLPENTAPGNHDALAAYDPATGAQLWVKRFALGFAQAIAVSPDGRRVFLIGQGADKFRDGRLPGATGARLWAREYKGRPGGESEATSVAASPPETR
jgi:hypothetical protein